MKYILFSLLSIPVIAGSCSKKAKTVTTITTTKVRSLDSICPTSLMGYYDKDQSGRERFIKDTIGGVIIHYSIIGTRIDNFFATVNCDSQTINIPVQPVIGKPSFFDSVQATGHIYHDMLVISYWYWEHLEYRKWLYMGDDTLRPR